MAALPIIYTEMFNVSTLHISYSNFALHLYSPLWKYMYLGSDIIVHL